VDKASSGDPSDSNAGKGLFERSWTLTLLGERFGGAYNAGFQCERGPDGRLFLTTVRAVQGGALSRGDAVQTRPPS